MRATQSHGRDVCDVGATTARKAERHADLSVSVVIPTKERPLEMAKVVRTILDQTVPALELIVVDQSLGDLPKRAVEKCFAESVCRNSGSPVLRFVHDPSISGAATARNLALEMVRGDVVLFLDDDVLLEPDFIAHLLQAYQKHPEAVGVSGIFTNYRPPPPLIRLWTMIFMRGPFHDDRQPIYWRAEQLRGTPPVRISRMTGALMSLRIESLAGQRFDPNLTGASLAEDADLTLRLHNSGKILFLDPNARLEHHHSPVGRAGDHWLRAHAQSSYYLYQRHWNNGLRNRAYFLWLNAGYAFIIAVNCVTRASLTPWRAFRTGMTYAGQLTGGRESAKATLA